MTRLVDHHGAGKDEHVVLPLGDLDAVGVAQGEPALRHRRYLPVSTLEDVLVVEEIALRLEIVRPRHVYGKPMVKEGEQLLTDERQLVPRQILERELTPEAERLAVDEVDLTALIVADVVVVAPRQELLLQHVAYGRSSWW